MLERIINNLAMFCVKIIEIVFKVIKIIVLGLLFILKQVFVTGTNMLIQAIVIIIVIVVLLFFFDDILLMLLS